MTPVAPATNTRTYGLAPTGDERRTDPSEDEGNGCTGARPSARSVRATARRQTGMPVDIGGSLRPPRPTQAPPLRAPTQ